MWDPYQRQYNFKTTTRFLVVPSLLSQTAICPFCFIPLCAHWAPTYNYDFTNNLEMNEAKVEVGLDWFVYNFSIVMNSTIGSKMTTTQL